MIFYSFMWIYIIPIYIMTPLISMSMNSWFSIWISIELNLMSFIPLVIYINKFYKELVMKYFIIQSISSMMILLTSNLMMFLNNLIYLKLMIFFMNLALMIKLGIPPFHYWYIILMNNMNWINCFLLSSWQKITPMILLMYNYLDWLMYLAIILSTMTSIFGLNHQSLRLIMSYSSINHMSWMLMNLLMSENLWVMYFLSYMIINLSIMLIFYKLNLSYLNQINTLKSLKFKMILISNFISLASLPPMLGFFMKWYSIFININNMNFLILIFLMMMSLITFYFYVKISIILLLNYKCANKMNLMYKMFYLNQSNFFNMSLMLSFLNLWIMNMWMM